MSGDYQFCPKCATPMETRTLDGHERRTCPECGFVYYRNPAPAAGVIVIEDGELLWVKRKFEPRAGGWTLPAGFVEYDEHVEETAVRETREETGLDVDIIRLFNAYMAMDDPRTQVILILYLATRTGGTLAAGDDAAEARFFPIDAPPDNIAFRAHRLALADIQKQFS